MISLKWFYKITGILLFLGFVTACGSSSPATPSSNNAVLLQVENNSNVEIGVIELTFSTNGTIHNTQGSMNANSSMVKRGESLTFEVDQGGLVTIEAAVTTKKSNGKVSIGNAITINLIKGQTAILEIIGDESSKLILKQKD